jgi:hypothetical protein
METFRTPLALSGSADCISLSDRILTIGSCFSDAIGSQLTSNKFRASVNPFGIIYNPQSIHKIVRYIVKNEPIPENTFLQRDDLFLNYDFHSEYASGSLEELKNRLTSNIKSAHLFLREAQWLILTYGTSWIYERIDTHEVVANCHKMPQRIFTKSLMTQKRIVDSFQEMYSLLKSFNPSIKIILTVSPVRHLKETLELNSVSKAILRVTCHTLSEQHNDVHYFPSYEIMMDDLRDYRFYKPDMIHPSEVAEEYIWQKFAERYFDDPLKGFLIRWKEIRSALNHRPFQPESPAHQQFISNTLKKLEELKSIVNVDEEIQKVKKSLKQKA